MINLRFTPESTDIEGIKRLLITTGVFHAFEIQVAVELLLDRIENGEKSEYYFVFADYGEALAGYACYGPVTVTEDRWELYWIGVDKSIQNKGIGTLLIKASEEAMSARGCRRVYIETSSREVYNPTRKFYMKSGYEQVCAVPGFYADGDDKVIYVKQLF